MDAKNIGFTNYSEAKQYIKSIESIPFEASLNLLKLCNNLLRKPAEENDGRDLVIRLLDKFDLIDSNTKMVWYDMIETAGLYPYLNYDNLEGSARLRYEYHKSPYLTDIYLHTEQMLLSLKLLNKESVVLSAPTSFGKSLLIEEIIASNQYNNIVIIQPTLALLDETRKKLRKYSDTYKIIASTNQHPDKESANIFLFTGERVVEYQHFYNIDFFIIDEFYKLSLGRDDERAIILNQAFYKLLKMTSRFYLLGPMVKNIPESFSKKFSFYWHHTTYSTVSIDEIPLFPVRQKKWGKNEKELELFKLLQNLHEPTLIYCSSPSKANKLLTNYVAYLNDHKKSWNNVSSNNSSLIEWTEENTHKEWILTEALRNGLAFHHGALPRHLGSSIVDAFNNRSITSLFCTTTLIEGVNTTAKNVILFDKLKGRKQIDYFDYRNISGRSGRMKQYFIGNVYRFEDEPLQLELEVDFPILTQDEAPEELF